MDPVMVGDKGSIYVIGANVFIIVVLYQRMETIIIKFLHNTVHSKIELILDYYPRLCRNSLMIFGMFCCIIVMHIVLISRLE